jgi:hypothetical protein
MPGYGGNVIFLVPTGWRYIGEVRRFRFWNALVPLIEIDKELMRDDVFRQYLLLIDPKFPSVRLTREEAQMVIEAPRKATVSLARKLHRTVDLLADHFRGLQFMGSVLETRIEPSIDEPARLLDEYGFLIHAGGKELLWIGMWGTEGLLLGAAYNAERYPKDKRISGFSPAKSEDGSGWEVLELNDLLLNEQSDVVSKAIEHLQPILREMLAG